MITALLFLMNVSKLWYNQARPFWVRPDIKAFDCSSQFGDPSGHSLNAIGMALLIWLDFNEHVSRDEQSRLRHWLFRVFALVLVIIFGFTIGYSRVFLGVHAWNQLLFGWMFGIWLALTYFFCYKDWILNTLD